MVARTALSRSLDGRATVFLLLQVKAVVEAGIKVFEVGVRGDTHTAIVPACRRRNIAVGRVRRPLCCPARVLVDEGQSPVVAAGVASTAEFEALSGPGERVVVRDVLLVERRVYHAHVSLRVDVVRTHPYRQRLREGDLQLDLAHLQVKRAVRQL